MVTPPASPYSSRTKLAMIKGRSIRFKFMASILLVLSLSISTVLFGIWMYERDELIRMAHNEAMQASQTIEKSLRSSMLENDREALRATIDEVSQIVAPPSRISVLAVNGRIAFSSQKSLVGKVVDRQKEPTCIVCHDKSTTIPSTNAIMVDSADGPLLRNVIKIVNDQTRSATAVMARNGPTWASSSMT